MHSKDLEQHKDKLRCAFCRNQLTNQECCVNDYQGDFVSVMCGPCNKQFKNNKNLGPKFVICCCSDEPRELSLEMAESEIKQQPTVLDKVKELGMESQLYKVKEFDEEQEPEFTKRSRNKRKVSNL